MIVRKLDGFRTIRGPNEANAKLIVHPDGILAYPVAFQRLQPVAWRRPQVVQRFGRVQIAELSTGNLHKISRKSLPRLAVWARKNPPGDRRGLVLWWRSDLYGVAFLRSAM